MSDIRKPRRVTRSQPVIEGAGVHLNRAFGHSDAPGFDPFLLLDDFRSSHPDQYLKGFPWRPHRGIETITYNHPVIPGYTVFAYVVEGRGGFAEKVAPLALENGTLVAFEDGDRIAAATADEAFRFLLVSGKAIGEPVAWQGPIVMNTREELDLAFREYRDGSFIKHVAGS